MLRPSFVGNYPGQVGRSVVPAKTMDQPAVPFRWPAHRSRCEVQAGFALFGKFAAGFPAGLGFPVKLLGDSGRSTDIAQAEHFDLEVSSFGFDGEHVPDPNLPRRTRRLVVGQDAAQFAGLRRESARFEEARCPQPFVETRAGHIVMLVDSGTETHIQRGDSRVAGSQKHLGKAKAKIWRTLPRTRPPDKRVRLKFLRKESHWITTRCCGSVGENAYDLRFSL